MVDERKGRAPLALAALLALVAPDVLSAGSLKARARAAVARDPIDATLGTLLVAASVFYLAERDINPKVRTFSDALVFISTGLSVGYSDIFAKTEVGKAVASVVMTVGPSMAASFFDAPVNAPVNAPGEPPRERASARGRRVDDARDTDAVVRALAEITERLEAILRAMPEADAARVGDVARAALEEGKRR